LVLINSVKAINVFDESNVFDENRIVSLSKVCYHEQKELTDLKKKFKQEQ